jgi:hypothetical protein
MTRYSSVLAIGFSVAASRALFAANAPGVDLLEQAGKRVERFWDDFSSVTCTEEVLQTKFGPTGKVIQKRKTTYDYLVLMQWAGEDINVEESRLPQRIPKSKASSSRESGTALLSTTGFAALLLILHPHFQNSYQFAPMPDEELAGRRLHRFRFEHVQGMRSISVLQLRRRDYPLEWKGVAWIDPQSGSVVKISASLKSSLDDVGLKQLSSEVTYAPIHFAGKAEEQWLPSVAEIEAYTTRQHWQNVHQFSGYRRFSVETETREANIKQ